MVLLSGTLPLDLKSKEPHEAQTIGYLVLHLVIREIIQVLENENFEHHQSIKGRPPRFTPVLRPGERNIEDRDEDVPVNVFFEFHERIFQLGESFKQKMFVEKTKWVDVFHDSNDKMR